MRPRSNYKNRMYKEMPQSLFDDIFAPRKGIQDNLGFSIPDSRNWIPVFVIKTWILDSNR